MFRSLTMNMGRTPDVFNLSFVYKEDDDINDINDVISNNNLLDTSIDTTNDDDNEQNNRRGTITNYY